MVTEAVECQQHCVCSQGGLGLTEDPDRPLVACITRLVPQKVHYVAAFVMSIAGYMHSAVGLQCVVLNKRHLCED